MEKIEIILTNCIEEIKSGKATIAECLNRYPSKRQELEPLLKIALRIQEAPAFQLDNNYKQVAKARLLQQIRASKQKKSRAFTDIFSFGLPRQYVRARMAVSVVVILVIISMLTGGMAYAAQDSLPGDVLYPVKIGVEDARLFLAGDSADKAELNLKFAQTRLVEMSQLASKNKGKMESAVNGYRGNLDAAEQDIQGISDASALSNLLSHALDELQKQTFFCDNVIDANPVYIGLVNEASTLAINQQVEFLEMLAQQNILQATQINLNAMQNRLQRAQVKAMGHQYETMQEVLLQYQQFNHLGEQILQSAQATDKYSVEIENLTVQALANYVNTLESISRQVPQEYQNSVEDCRQMTLQFQTQARHRHQERGNSDTRFEGPSSGGIGGSGMGQDSQTAPQYQGESGGDIWRGSETEPGDGGGFGGGSGSGIDSGRDTTSSGGSGVGTASSGSTADSAGGHKP